MDLRCLPLALPTTSLPPRPLPAPPVTPVTATHVRGAGGSSCLLRHRQPLPPPLRTGKGERARKPLPLSPPVLEEPTRTGHSRRVAATPVCLCRCQRRRLLWVRGFLERGKGEERGRRWGMRGKDEGGERRFLSSLFREKVAYPHKYNTTRRGGHRNTSHSYKPHRRST